MLIHAAKIAWYLGDSTESLLLLASGVVDIALTYVPAAEQQLIDSGAASKRVYAFRDRFALVGPPCNTAGLDEKDSVETMFTKIVNCGNADVEVEIVHHLIICSIDLTFISVPA